MRDNVPAKGLVGAAVPGCRGFMFLARRPDWTLCRWEVLQAGWNWRQLRNAAGKAGGLLRWTLISCGGSMKPAEGMVELPN